MQSGTSNKILPLESMRGIAALIVVVFHFIFGFAPQRHGQEAQTAIAGGNLLESPFFFLINGHAAVLFFFVLSGFVLSHKFFSRGSNVGLIDSVIKRWPRLFPLAMASTVLSWIFLNLDLYTHREAAAITKSGWMGSFAYSGADLSKLDFFDSFMQGFFYTFFRGDKSLNTSLWTMHYEFIGSLLVFGLIPVLNGLKNSIALCLFVLLFVVCYQNNILYSAFVTGCFLSYYRCQIRQEKPLFQPNKYSFLGALFIIIICFNYFSLQQPLFNFLSDISPIPGDKLRTISYVVASACLIQLILNHQKLYNLLNGSIGIFLGRCSFAIYVMHVPIMFTCGSAVFLFFQPITGYVISVLLAFIATLIPTFLVSWYLTRIDESWCKALGRHVKRLTHSKDVNYATTK